MEELVDIHDVGFILVNLSDMECRLQLNWIY